MALLLRPGGLLLGSTLGAAAPHAWEAAYQPGRARWLHSATSLAEALAAAGYEGVVVEPTSWRVRARAGQDEVDAAGRAALVTPR